jgi:hypothetical protein
MSPLLLAVLAVVHASDLIPLVALLQLLAAGRFAAARDWEAEVRNQWCNPLNALLLRSAAQEKVCFCSRN